MNLSRACGELRNDCRLFSAQALQIERNGIQGRLARLVSPEWYGGRVKPGLELTEARIAGTTIGSIAPAMEAMQHVDQ